MPCSLRHLLKRSVSVQTGVHITRHADPFVASAAHEYQINQVAWVMNIIMSSNKATAGIARVFLVFDNFDTVEADGEHDSEASCDSLTDCCTVVCVPLTTDSEPLVKEAMTKLLTCTVSWDQK